MKRALATLLLLMIPHVADAAGTITVAITDFGDVRKYSIAWTSDAGGSVAGNALGISRGRIIQAQFVPGAGGTQPTASYDVVLNDAASVDLLITNGANLDNATSKLLQFHPPLYHDGQSELDLVVANAGNAKTGTFVLWVER